MSVLFDGEKFDMDKKSISFDIETLGRFFKKVFGFDVQLDSIGLDGYIHLVIGKKYHCTGAYFKHGDGTIEFRLWLLYENESYYAEGFSFIFQNTLSELWLMEKPINFFIEHDAFTTQFVGIRDSGLHDGHYQSILHGGEILHRYVRITPLNFEVSYRLANFLHYESRIPEIRDWIRKLVG